MWKGYAGRNSAKRSWAGLTPINQPPSPVSNLSSEPLYTQSSSTAACRIQNFAEVRSRTSPFACVQHMPKAARQELPCTTPEYRNSGNTW